MENATVEKSRTNLVLVLIAMIAAVVVIAAIAAVILLDTPAPTTEPTYNEETIQHNTADTEEIWEEEETEPEEIDTSPASVLHLLPENPYGKFDFQYDGWFLKSTTAECLSGIDVSAYQGDIDWEQVAQAGVDFAIIRLGYRGYESGKLVEDKFARKNLEGAASAGIQLGVYFFSQALNEEEAREEAQFVLDMIDPYEVAMPVVFDWEHVNSETARTNEMDPYVATDCAKAFLEVIDDAGYWPMMYFNTSQSRKLFYLDQLMQYDFWLALYSDRMTFPYKIDMWQYTSTGTIPGVFGDVDVNVLFLDE